MTYSTVLKLLLMAMTSLSLIACGGSSGSSANESAKEQNNTKQEETTTENSSFPKHVISTMENQPELEIELREIDTTTQSSALGIMLNTKNRFRIPKLNSSIDFHHIGSHAGYTVIKADFDELGKAFYLSAYYDSNDENIRSRDDLFISADKKTIYAVIPTFERLRNYLNLASYGGDSSYTNDVEGDLIFTELNKETLELTENEFLVDMHAKNVAGNCIAQEIEESKDELGYSRIRNDSLSYHHFLVINLVEKYFRALGSSSINLITINGNKLIYSDVEKPTGYGWSKVSYTASGIITINVEAGTLIDESEGKGRYSLGGGVIKDCDEQYYEEGKIILQ